MPACVDGDRGAPVGGQPARRAVPRMPGLAAAVQQDDRRLARDQGHAFAEIVG
jgi:hypothetical protein